MTVDTVVVGAGVAGLSCAQSLHDEGRSVLVVDKARGVGGRCATRRLHGQAVDHGVVFLHGSDPEFVEALRRAGEVREGWPQRVEGHGSPCRPEAFTPGETRLAYPAGVTTFPKSLAAGLDVRLSHGVVRVGVSPAGIRVDLEEGGNVEARDVIVALPIERARELVAPLAGEHQSVRSACAVLEMAATLPCLVVIAGYRIDAASPVWHVAYPDDSAVLQLASHDSEKRDDPKWLVVVWQGRPAWSAARLQASVETWTAELLAEAARLFGAWAAQPEWLDIQRWRHARADGGSAFSGPLLIPLGPRGRLGFAGEAFAPRGGVEAAWTSGRRLARRLLGRE